MNIADRIPGLRDKQPKPAKKHRAVDALAEVQADNAKLLDRQLASDDFFALLYDDAVTTNAAWQQEKERREQAERTIAQLEAVVQLRDRRIADLTRKVDVGVKAEHVIAKTQELDTDEIRRQCVKPVPLHQSPMAADAGLMSPVVRISASGASAGPGHVPAA